MKLRKLEIELPWYGPLQGQYVGKVEFEDSTKNAVTMVLPPEVSNLVLGALGDHLASLVQKTADELAANIRKSIEETKQPALQLPPEPGAIT